MSRVMNFSSSSMSMLMANGRAAGSIGKPFYTYIEEKYFEFNLGRKLQRDANSAKPLAWGNLAEWFAFQNLGMEYKLTTKKRLVHPDIKNWTGIPDGTSGDTVIDIKSPWTLKSFCQMAQSFEQGLEAFKKLKPEYYYQLVSNSILTGCKYAELILYVPWLEELEDIKAFVGTDTFFDLDLVEGNYYWLNFSEDNELPYLSKKGKYKNITKFKFEVPQADKDALFERVTMANYELNKLKGI